MTQLAPGSEPEVNIDDLAKSIAGLTEIITGIAKAPPATKSKKSKKPAATDEEKAAKRAASEAEVSRVFKAAGYASVEPRVNVMTYKKWLAEGRQVRKGERGHRVGPFNLFHKDQTDPISAS